MGLRVSFRKRRTRMGKRKREGGEYTTGQRERKKENEKGRYFGSCEKKYIYI